MQYQTVKQESTCSYRVAIHLNNVGVSLLQRKAYRQALDTLRDAVSVIRSTFTDCSDELRDAQDARTEVMLAKAARRLASPKCLVSSAQVVTVSDHISVTGINSFATSVSNDKTLFAVEIEHFGLEERDADIDSAIILHNFALAHLLLSRAAKQPRYAKQLQSGAQKVSALAYRTLAAMMVVESEDELEELILLKPPLFLAAVSVLHSMVQILAESNSMARSRQSLMRLSILKAAITEVQEPTLGSQVAAAA